MATYTLVYKSKCAATVNPHVTFNIKRNATVIRTITVDPTELETTDIDVHELAMMLIKLALRTAKPTTMTKARTAIEAIQVII